MIHQLQGSSEAHQTGESQFHKLAEIEQEGIRSQMIQIRQSHPPSVDCGPLTPPLLTILWKVSLAQLQQVAVDYGFNMAKGTNAVVLTAIEEDCASWDDPCSVNMLRSQYSYVCVEGTGLILCMATLTLI